MIELFVRIAGLATDLPYQKGDQFQGFVFIPNQKGTSVVGKWGDHKAKFNINSDGWNAVRDYTPQRSAGTTRLAVIGDSIVLATNVDPSSSMSAFLERALLKRDMNVEVYPFGQWSASASHYLVMMRYVRKRFSPELYIITIVHGDISESIADPARSIYFGVRENGDSFEEVPPQPYQPSSNRRLIGHLAIARYLYQNLQIRRLFQEKERAGHQFEANINVGQMMERDKAKRLTTYIFEKYLHEVGDDRRRLLLLMDAVREPIYAGIHPNTTAAFQYNRIVSETCQELALYCLDLTDAFWSDFQVNKRRFNSVIDTHWDEYGHEVVAKAVEDYLLRNDLLENR